MTTSQLDVPGGRLHVIDEGSGPPIVLLHAGIADTRSWDTMVPLLNGEAGRSSLGGLAVTVDLLPTAPATQP